MISRHSALIALLLSVTLAACGGGDATAADTGEKPQGIGKPTTMIFVGNSLTYVPPGGSPQSGVFSGGWGVAASSQDKDYAHLVASAQGLPLSVENRADLEVNPATEVPTWNVTPSTIVVVQLGDNGMPAKYADLLWKFRKAHTLICISTWWNQATRDAVIKGQCEDAGGRYVWIGDLFANRKDDVGAYENPGVDAHPHDWGMAEIAARVNAALR